MFNQTFPNNATYQARVGKRGTIKLEWETSLDNTAFKITLTVRRPESTADSVAGGMLQKGRVDKTAVLNFLRGQINVEPNKRIKKVLKDIRLKIQRLPDLSPK